VAQSFIFCCCGVTIFSDMDWFAAAIALVACALAPVSSHREEIMGAAASADTRRNFDMAIYPSVSGATQPLRLAPQRPASR